MFFRYRKDAIKCPYTKVVSDYLAVVVKSLSVTLRNWFCISPDRVRQFAGQRSEQPNCRCNLLRLEGYGDVGMGERIPQQSKQV